MNNDDLLKRLDADHLALLSLVPREAAAEIRRLQARAEAAEAEAHAVGAERAVWKGRAEAAGARVAGMTEALTVIANDAGWPLARYRTSLEMAQAVARAALQGEKP